MRGSLFSGAQVLELQVVAINMAAKAHKKGVWTIGSQVALKSVVMAKAIQHKSSRSAVKRIFLIT